MKTIQFSMNNKRYTIETTGNPFLFRVLIDNETMYRCGSVFAKSIFEVLDIAQTTRLGVR